MQVLLFMRLDFKHFPGNLIMLCSSCAIVIEVNVSGKDTC